MWAQGGFAVLVGVALALTGCTGDPVDPPPPAANGEVVAEVGVVADVIDGDTIDVAGVGRIRYRGIDTPERGECGFGPATSALKRLVLGNEVELLYAGSGDNVDSYGRLLRYVDVGGVDTGLALIEAGLAIARYDSRDGYDWHPREATYIAADEAVPQSNSC